MARSPHRLHPLASDRSGAPDSSTAGQHGFGLIEVLVSALLVTLTALGVYAGLDAAGAASGTNKDRAMAAEVAQQDQERMRAFKSSDLSNLRQQRVQMVAGVPYTVTSRADWITDSSGTASCSGGQASADYLKISSTVTWPAMHIQPVAVSSLVAPPNGSFAANQGSLAIQVVDRNANPVANMPISLTGPQSFTDATNSLGCVLYGYLTAGNYTASATQSGWVDPQGNTTASTQTVVTGQTTSPVSLTYDQAGALAVNFQTVPSGRPLQASSGGWATLASSGLAPPGTRILGSGQPQTQIASNTIFPFPNGYAVYSGNCQGADPRTYGQPAGAATVAPNGSASVYARQPALNVKVTYNGVPIRANVKATVVTALTPGCAGTVVRQTNPATGTFDDPGFPYGTYNVCADNGQRRMAVANVADTNQNGSAVQSLDLYSRYSSAGTCP